MRVSSASRPAWAAIFLLISTTIVASGCSRLKYRLQADREAYDVIAERNFDPRWSSPDFTIEIDPRSRYFDANDPDHSPMPPDDPDSQQYMHLVDGMKGWKHWNDNGHEIELENPAWREALAEYVEIGEDDSVKLNVDSALRLAYVHSSSHQRQLETLYLSALDVTAERFRLDTQFFGGYDARYAHNGSVIPPRLSFVPVLNRFIITPAFDGPGVENNRLTVGRPFGANPALQASRRFATAGELLAGFANSFVFEFTGGGANLSASLANFSFIQPLLRGAGKDIALEQLTFVERGLLANLRAYGQFRQGFYTQVAIGELGVIGPQRQGRNTNLASFSGQGGLGGYLGLLQQLQRIRNTEDNLSLQLRTLSRLEAFLDVGVIDLVQVDQFRQSVERERASLLQSRNLFELSLDRYKTGTLGLPPNLPIDLDDTLIRPFQFVPREATEIQDSIVELQRRIGQIPDDAGVELVEQVLSDGSRLVEAVQRQYDDVQEDLARMDEAVPMREQTMTDEQRRLFQLDREQLVNKLVDLRREFDESTAKLERLRNGLFEQTPAATSRELVSWVAKFLRNAERLVLVPARARLEALTVEAIELDSEDAFEIALENRLDFMNGRAALVDDWRLIQVSADALQSVLDVTASGDVRTDRNNPVSFRAPTATLRMGLEFDAPFTRLLERNAYRESLIEYQRSRRDFIQSQDSLHLGLRALLRQIEQLRENLEIQRRAVTIAIRRVDLTQAALSAPVRPPQPGQRPAQFTSTTAINLLSAQSDLRDTQNNFLGVWLDYYATRMRLSRELGIMVLDPEGQWIDYPIPGSGEEIRLNEWEELPPVPIDWIDFADYHAQQASGPPTFTLEPAGYITPLRPDELRRLPPTAYPVDTNGYRRPRVRN
jgi:hypothetical protein